MTREAIRQMFGNHCAFCGKELSKTFHVEHLAPIYRGRKDDDKPAWAGKDEDGNKVPACPRCNRWKKVFTVEQFRKQIELQTKRLRHSSAAFRLAEDFGVVEVTGKRVTFWFERDAEIMRMGED